MGALGRDIIRKKGYLQKSEEDFSLHENGFMFQNDHLKGAAMLGLGLGAISYTKEIYYMNTQVYNIYKDKDILIWYLEEYIILI